MIRILQCVNNMHRAGLETMLMNYYRNIDRSRIQFDFLMHREERSDYDDEIEALGGRIFRAPRLYPQNYPAYFAYMKRFFKEHSEYKIVHSHIDSMSYLPLLAAKRAGVPVRIAHSHNTAIDRDYKYLLKQLFRLGITGVANTYVACGEEAGKFLFGNKPFRVLPNAINAEQFLFDGATRIQKRKELGLEDRFIVGHVGRMSYQKNHTFLLDIFCEIAKRREDAVLLLIGAGEREEEIRQKVKNMNMMDQVIFLGIRSDVKDLYQAIDVFLLPSLFEGVPVVGIEAQFSGLPCVFSDKVPKEVQIAENCEFVELTQPAELWAEKVLKLNILNRNNVRVSSDYDIKYAHTALAQYYNELYASLFEK